MSKEIDIIYINRLLNRYDQLRTEIIDLLFDSQYFNLLEQTFKLLRSNNTLIAQDIVHDVFLDLSKYGLAGFKSYDELHAYLIDRIKFHCTILSKESRLNIQFANVEDESADGLTLEEKEENNRKAKMLQKTRNAYAALSDDKKKVFEQLLNGATADQIAKDSNVFKQKIVYMIETIKSELREAVLSS